MLPRNPAALIDAPRWIGRQVTALTDEHARSLLNACDGDLYGMIYTLALALGLRRGEVLGLRWLDVDLDAGTIAIGGQFQYHQGEWRYMEPKTVRSRRTLVLPDFVRVWRRQERARSFERRLAAGPSWNDFGLVFQAKRGSLIKERTCRIGLQRS